MKGKLQTIPFRDLSGFRQQVNQEFAIVNSVINSTRENSQMYAQQLVAQTAKQLSEDLGAKIIASDGAEQLINEAIVAQLTNTAEITFAATNAVVVEMRKDINAKAEASDVASTFEKLTSAIDTKAEQSTVNDLTSRVETCEADIETIVEHANQNAENIERSFSTLEVFESSPVNADKA